MAIQLIPYGQLEGGNFGTLIDPGTGKPLAAVVEVFATLPAVAASENFVGRLIFEVASQTLYVFQDTPAAFWFPLEGIPSEVGTCIGPGGGPPIVPTPSTGFLFWCTDTEIMYVWDGGQWQPIGGRFAASFVTVGAIGDGFTTDFPHGAPASATPLTNDLVEVFVDGVRQYPNGIAPATGQWSIIGPNVVFNVAPALSTEIVIRSATSNALVQNAQVFNSTTVAAPAQTTFDAGNPALDPAGTFVYEDGLLQSDGIDYNHVAADTTIDSIVKVAPTTARATVSATVPHNIPVSSVVEIEGVLEPDLAGSVTITATTATTFDYTVLASAPASGTPDPTMFYSPPFVNDLIVFTSPLSGGEVIDIRSIKSVVTAPSAGEANTGSNLGGGEDVFNSKFGVDLQFNTLLAGSNVTITPTGTELIISASSGAIFEDRTGINTFVHSLSSTESYIGVRNTSLPVTIDLSTVPAGTAGSGRRIIIQDESGGASINNIQIVHAGATFSGVLSPVSITTNNGTKYLVFDGTNWHVVTEK